MRKVNLLAVVLMLLGLGFVPKVKANPVSPATKANTISAQIDFGGGIVDPDDDDEDEEDGNNKKQ